MTAPGRVPLDPSIYLVTDTGMCGGLDGVVRTVVAAAGAGVTAVQLRDPVATTSELVELAEALLVALRETTVPLIINDRVDVALAVGAAGVHLGQRDLDPVTARRLLGPGPHIGLSVSNLAELQSALALPAGTVDLLGVGPIRATASKPDAAKPLGFVGLQAICAASSVSCVAIGGLSAADAPALRQAGAAGMAVISAICGTPDPAAAAAKLRTAWTENAESGDRS